MMLETTISSNCTLDRLLENLKWKYPSGIWKISDSEYLGRHLVGTINQLRIEIEINSSTVDLSVIYPDVSDYQQAQELFDQILQWCRLHPTKLYFIIPIPVVADFIQNGISADAINHYFGYSNVQTVAQQLRTKANVIPLSINGMQLDHTRLSLDGEEIYSYVDAISQHAIQFHAWEMEIDQETARLLHCELLVELGIRHQLYTIAQQWKVTWRSSANDDVLFMDPRTQQYYVVHLTWSRNQEAIGYPDITKFKSFQEWVENVLCVEELKYY